MIRSKEEWALRFKRDAAQYLIDLERHLQLSVEAASQITHAALSDGELANLYELYRLAHTIKGSAAMLELTDVAQPAEQLEQLFGTQYRAKTLLSTAQCEVAQTLINQLQLSLDLIG